jgi:hypothetical protein
MYDLLSIIFPTIRYRCPRIHVDRRRGCELRGHIHRGGRARARGGSHGCAVSGPAKADEGRSSGREHSGRPRTPRIRRGRARRWCSRCGRRRSRDDGRPSARSRRLRWRFRRCGWTCSPGRRTSARGTRVGGGLARARAQAAEVGELAVARRDCREVGGKERPGDASVDATQKLDTMAKKSIRSLPGLTDNANNHLL